MNDDDTYAEVAAIFAKDPNGFAALLRLDEPGEPQRREALMTFVVGAYGMGYKRGLRRGSEMLKDAVLERVGR